ncbi:MAG TPA: cob(I)yrinic acid a,c-diamide adenosyltransferase [Rhodoblastus sp.]|nr:cob(I)yrinic acid a,c-diamide adenosyltransferase [Rhodoblastus sp.]
MVRLNKIYTRTGDDGTTALVSGGRRSKADLRVEAYGAIDETNASIGVARAALDGTEPALVAMLARIQNDLFDLGADLATPADAPRAEGALRIVQSQVDRLEREIDELNAELQPLKSFILPGGSAAAAALHLARTIARRAERVMVALVATPGERVDDPAMRYVNRLSDFLFVASRTANQRGAADVLWAPGQNR